MRNSKRSGSFLLCFFINMLMNIEGLLPSVARDLPKENKNPYSVGNAEKNQ